jgi:hypothetical protein
MKPRMIVSLVFGIGIAMSALLATPALAWWQFIERPPGFERKPSPRYQTEQECNDALKTVAAALKKAYPNRYPLVGSCEEYR